MLTLTTERRTGSSPAGAFPPPPNAGQIRLEPGTTKNRGGRTFRFGSFPPLVELLEAEREQTRAVEKRQRRVVAHVFYRDGEPSLPR